MIKKILISVSIIILILLVVFTTPTFSNNKKSDSKFNYAISIVMQHEGSLSEDKNDPGDITKYGISLRFIRAENIDVDGDGDSDRDDILNLTQSEADSIYMKDWWKKYQYEKINDNKVAAKIFDMSVNMGASQCHKMVKRSINEILNANIPINGILDLNTIKLINKIEPVLMHAQLRVEQENFYKLLIIKHPQLRVFLKGWLNRAAW